MSLSTLNHLPTPSGNFGNNNRQNKDNKNDNITSSELTKALKTIQELDNITVDLIESFKSDITANMAPSQFWLEKAKESLDDFNDLINDYLVKKNERNLINIDYDCIYVYYRAGQMILHDIVPPLEDFRDIQEDYALLMNELINNDMYFMEIKRIIETRTTAEPAQPPADALLARFNNLKRSFGSSINAPVPLYTHLQDNQPIDIQSPSPLSATPRSRSPTPTLLQQMNDHHSSSNFSDSYSRPVTPTSVPPFDIATTQSPRFKPMNRFKSPPGIPYKSRSLSPVKNIGNNNFFIEFNNKSLLRPVELNDLVGQYPSSVLVIDYRSTSEFDNRHIYFANSSNVIHIDPLSVRKDYNTNDIENSSMMTNSDHETNLFKNRNMFELVVIYDQDSKDLLDNKYLQILFNILSTRNSDKPLIRNPLLLSGGLNSWIRLYGAAGIASNLGIIRDDLSIDVRNEGLTRPVAIPSRLSGSIDYYKEGTPHSSSHSSLNSFGKLTYNRSQTDFFSQLLQNKPSPAPEKQPHFPQQPNKMSRSNSQVLQKINVDIDRPQSAVCSPRRTSSSSNDSQLLEAQKRQQKIDSFDNNLTIITGISNMGNTCYMNCILQCLVGTKGLTKFFLMKEYENKINFKSRLGSKGMISKAFHSVVNDMFNRSVTTQKQTYYITPQKFKQIIGALNSDFRGFQQQDCSEFLNYLLDSLHEDLNQKGDAPKFPPLTPEEELHREKMSIRLAASIEWEKYLKTDFSSIVDFFQGQYLSRLQCTVCRTTSTTYNAFSTLSVPIPEHIRGPVTLEQCFEEFCKTEILDGDDKWHCPRCKKKQVATKTLKISILPKNLIIHLKRFKIGNFVTKLNTFVNYPLDISLLKFWPQVENETDKYKMRNFPDRGQTPPFNYQLYGVVNHFGSLRSGHYTAYVNKGDSNGVKNGWCYFDDTTVTRNCDSSKVVNDNAYVLFYRRV